MHKLIKNITSVIVISWVGTFALFTHQVSSEGITESLTKGITIEQGYVRETIPGTSISSAYMNINNNTEQSVSLLGASSDVSQRIEIHQHTMLDGMMKMRRVESVNAEAGDTLTLAPSGYHLMIFDLTEPLQAGQSMTITLHFSGEKNIEITLPVQSIKRQQPAHHH